MGRSGALHTGLLTPEFTLIGFRFGSCQVEAAKCAHSNPNARGERCSRPAASTLTMASSKPQSTNPFAGSSDDDDDVSD